MAATGRLAAPALVAPEWSIVVPSYNCAPYLPAAIDSVLAQRPNRIAEFEVVDDRSTDDTALVLKGFAGDGVRHHVNPENQGPIANFNTCLRRATGDLVHLLHADDEVLPGFYARIEAAFRHDGVVAAVCRAEYIDEHGTPMTITRAEQETSGVWRRAREVLTVSNRVRPAAIVVRRRAYEAARGVPSRPAPRRRLGDVDASGVPRRHLVRERRDGAAPGACGIRHRRAVWPLRPTSPSGRRRSGSSRRANPSRDTWRLQRQAMGYTAAVRRANGDQARPQPAVGSRWRAGARGAPVRRRRGAVARRTAPAGRAAGGLADRTAQTIGGRPRRVSFQTVRHRSGRRGPTRVRQPSRTPRTYSPNGAARRARVISSQLSRYTGANGSGSRR